jgi:hypothetical protein
LKEKPNQTKPNQTKTKQTKPTARNQESNHTPAYPFAVPMTRIIVIMGMEGIVSLTVPGNHHDVTCNVAL